MTKVKKWIIGRITFQLYFLALSVYGIFRISREGGRVWLAILILVFGNVFFFVQSLYEVHKANKNRK